MNKTRTVWTSIVTLALCAACGPSGDRSESKTEGRLIGVSFQTMTNPFFVDLNEGIEAVVKANGDTLITVDAQWDSLKQKNDVSDLILRGASAIFINPVNWEGVKGSLLQAEEKGIPVIVVDAPVKDRSLVLSTVASDNIEAGRLAARALAAARRPAKVAILSYSLNKACIDRVAGFKEVLKEYPDMVILDEQEIRGTTESARPVMRDLIARYPEVDAVFAINDPAALGVISALESAGKLDSVLVAAVDGADEAIHAIQKGRMLSTSAQFPREIGTASAELIYEHFTGTKVPQDVKVRVELITKENAASFLKQE